MQNKNLLTLILLTLLLFIGWAQLVNWIWPPPPRKPKPPPAPTPITLPQPQLWAGLPGALAGADAGPAQLATICALAAHAAGEPAPAVAKAPEPPKAAAPEPPVPAAEHREIVLGEDAADSPFNFQVVLTSHGAGVQRLVLNKFLQANRLGQPDGDPPPPLHLIPDNPGEPSNLLYHYAPSEETHPEHPLDTLGKLEWAVVPGSVKNGAQDPIHEAAFSATLPGLGVKITKAYTLDRGTYHLGLTLIFERAGGDPKPLPFRYQLTSGHGLPIEGEWYTTIYRNAMIGLEDAQRQVWRDLQAGQAVGYQEGGRAVFRPEDKIIRYSGVATQYFASLLVVDDHQQPGVKQNFLAWTRPTIEGVLNKERPFLDDMTARAVSESIELAPGAPVVHKYLLYNGPLKVRLLGHLAGVKAVAPELIDRYEIELGLNSLTDTGTIPGWSQLLISCTNLMHGLMYYLHKYVMPWSYGLCIILLTVLVRAAMFPISRRQAVASAKMQARMAELQPEIKKLEEKYRNDRMELQRAKQDLMLKRGVNPLAMMGSCWLVFLQMPIFLGLYYSLQESINFRLAPFLWMKNLAAPDMLIWWGENIPVISKPDFQGTMLGMFYLGPFFNILPIIAVVFMIIQQKLLTPPATDEQQEMQQKTMQYMMIFFGLMFYRVAAGLCLYFIVSSGWGLAERKLFIPKTQPGAGGRGDQSKPAKQKPKGPNGNGNGRLQKVRDLWEQVLKEARKK